MLKKLLLAAALSIAAVCAQFVGNREHVARPTPGGQRQADGGGGSNDVI